MLERIGLAHDPDTLVGSLPVSEQQLVEIARALSEDAKVILMDEPTAALTEVEAAALFSKIDELKATGVAILYVSHRLDEVMRLADRITVLRDGALIASGTGRGLHRRPDHHRHGRTHHRRSLSPARGARVWARRFSRWTILLPRPAAAAFACGPARSSASPG